MADRLPLEAQLLAEMDKFTHFVGRQVADPELAFDVVQDRLLKVMKSADQLRDEVSVTAWFY